MADEVGRVLFIAAAKDALQKMKFARETAIVDDDFPRVLKAADDAMFKAMEIAKQYGI